MAFYVGAKHNAGTMLYSNRLTAKWRFGIATTLFFSCGIMGSLAVAVEGTAGNTTGKTAVNTTVTRVVGEVGGEFVTSREVSINEAVTIALGNIMISKKLTPLGDAKFSEVVRQALDEAAVYLEAVEVGTRAPDKSEVMKLAHAVADSWKGRADWDRLEAGASEVRLIVEKKLMAESLAKLKSDASTIIVSDVEALQYYKKNKQRFGDAPFENFQDNIKAALGKKQMERRQNEWRAILRRKYHVRSLIGN